MSEEENVQYHRGGLPHSGSINSTDSTTTFELANENYEDSSYCDNSSKFSLVSPNNTNEGVIQSSTKSSIQSPVINSPTNNKKSTKSSGSNSKDSKSEYKLSTEAEDLISSPSGMAPLNRSKSSSSSNLPTTVSESSPAAVGNSSGVSFKEMSRESNETVAMDVMQDDKFHKELVEDHDTFHTPSTSLQNLSETQDYDTMFLHVSSSYEHGNNSNCSQSPNSTQSLDGNKESSPEESFVNNKGMNDDTVSISSSICLTPGSGISSELTQSMDSNISRESNSSGNNSISTSKETLLLPGNYNSKPTKKKMWYHVFTPSYKSRSHDFRKYFKDLPSDERLIVDYSCALQKEILVQGRMYVSQNYISFYANIFGWQTQMSIKFKDVATITKENTALVIPNAVQVNTANDKFFFTSFVSRDSTYVMLFKLWQTALLDENMPTKEIWKLVHASYGDELGIESEEAEEIDDCLSLVSGSIKAANSLLSISDVDERKSIEIEPVCSSEIPVGVLLGNSIVAAAGLHGVARLSSSLETGKITDNEILPTDVTDDSSESDVEVPPPPQSLLSEIPICPNSHSEGRIVVDSCIPCDIDELFTMLFTNSKFYLDFHTSRKTFDIVQSDWQEKEGKTMRQISFTLSLNHVMGPKHSHVTETQVMLPTSKPGCMYAVDVETSNGGIPYADAFYVICHFCMSRVGPKESRLIIQSQIKYRKSIWGITKSFIEKNTWAGIEEFYTSLEKSLKEECLKGPNATASPPPSPRVKSGSLPRRRVPKKKGRAPGIPLGVTAFDAATDGNISTLTRAGSLQDLSNLGVDNSLVLKVILSVLAGLLILNAFLYFKLSRLESTANAPFLYNPYPVLFHNKEPPHSHQEWLTLLQQQEALHRVEIEKWHNILVSSLKVLHQAETELEGLQRHIGSYEKTHLDFMSQDSSKEVPGT